MLNMEITKLAVNDGHVWDSLVTVIITFPVKLFGANINRRALNGSFSTHFCVNLKHDSFRYFRTTERKKTPTLLVVLKPIFLTSVIISASCRTVTSLFGLPTLKIWPFALSGFS